MVGSMKTRGKTAAMAKSATAQSHSTHDPAVDMVAPPPLITAPPTGPAVGSSNLRGTATEHGGTSHQATSTIPSIASTLNARSCRMDDQTSLMRQLLNQMNLVQNLSLGQPGEERRMDERTDRQLNRYPAGRAGVGRQGEGQQLDRPTDMSQAFASPTQSRLSLRNNVRERLGPRLDIQTRLGPQGSEMRSVAHSRRDSSRRQATENLSQA
ncbi:unnamed protein product [Prunus brigantina]